jgi:hypothetical protein
MTGDGKVCCGAGYKQGPPGGYACEDLNECVVGSDDCDVHASCYNQPGTFKCVCAAGYVGDGKSCAPTTAPDPCLGPTTCSKDATCSASTSGYDCTCKEGFTGNGTVCCGDGYVLNVAGNLCNDLNECTSNTDNCSDNAYCYNNPGGFSCQCKPGYLGDGLTCTAKTPDDPCTSGASKCGANATCTTTGATTYECDCDPGYTGNGQVCCAEGFVLNATGNLCNDVNECETENGGCAADAYCYNNPGGFYCQCKGGFVGDGLTCAPYTGPANPCADGTAQCDSNATCNQTTGGYNCKCNAGFVADGNTCTPMTIDPCSGVTLCSPNATCSATANGYKCTCKAGYTGTGTTCTAGSSSDPCADGTNDCSPNATCTKTSAGYLCKCKTGYSGTGKVCDEIDECATNKDNCSNTCTNEPPGSFTCSCPAGFKLNGGYCADINECLDMAKIGCEGICSNSNGSYQCFGKGGISSIEDPNTPYPETQCAGSVGPEAIWFQTHKTTFPVDCRCPPGSSQPGAKFCAAPFGTATGGVKIGTGVSPADHTSANIQGCATNYTAKTVYFGVTWSNNLDNTRGYIMAVDPVTGNRTIVSGDYFNPAEGVVTVGTGNKFDLIKDMALGPDGLLYVFEDSVPGSTFAPDDTNPDLQGRSVYSVDLTTGNRTLIWNHQTWNHPEFVGCSNGQPVPGNPLKTTDIQIHGFELFENGDFLFATNGNVNPSEGEGFIRVGKDGKSCTWITRSSTKSGNLLFGVTEGAGSGVDVAAGFDSGFGYKDGFIYATAFLTGSLYKVEVATGKRSMIWNKMQPTVGTGPGPGVWHFFYYPHFGLWVAGGNELGTPSNAALFDPASGDTWGWMYKKPDGSVQGSGNELGGSNDAYNGPVGIQTNQLRGPILGAKYETLSDRPWCISPVAPNRLLVATDSVGVVIVEVETGNTMNLSL